MLIAILMFALGLFVGKLVFYKFVVAIQSMDDGTICIEGKDISNKQEMRVTNYKYTGIKYIRVKNGQQVKEGDLLGYAESINDVTVYAVSKFGTSILCEKGKCYNEGPHEE